MNAIRWSLDCDLPVQVNTLVAAETSDDLEPIYDLVCTLGVERWAVFFLIATGRGAALREVTPDQSEDILNWLYNCSTRGRPIIKTTEAHHFRRVAAQRQLRDREVGGSARSPAGSIRRGWGIRDGAGIMFISHRGDVYPSGFLPIKVGNVRHDDPVSLYRHGGLFRELRANEKLRGKCGRCEFRAICGGSRARAYAAGGDPLGADPLCPYEPRIGPPQP